MDTLGKLAFCSYEAFCNPFVSLHPFLFKSKMVQMLARDWHSTLSDCHFTLTLGPKKYMNYLASYTIEKNPFKGQLVHGLL